MARRDEGEYPWWIFDGVATKPEGLWRENPPGGRSFGRSRRWLGPPSPLRGLAGLAVSAAAKIPFRGTPPIFQTGSNGDETFKLPVALVYSIFVPPAAVFTAVLWHEEIEKSP